MVHNDQYMKEETGKISKMQNENLKTVKTPGFFRSWEKFFGGGPRYLQTTTSSTAQNENAVSVILITTGATLGMCKCFSTLFIMPFLASQYPYD
jgi:hypothetical protein